MRTVLLITMLLLSASACSDDVAAEPGNPSGGQAAKDSNAADAGSCGLSISLIDYKLVPSELSAKAGKLRLCATNNGKAPHDLAVRDPSNSTLGRTRALGPEELDSFEVELSAGSYDIYCTQGGHESLGMRGTLTVD